MTLPRPQRLTPPSAVGSLLKRAGVPTRSRISSEERNPDYRALITQLPCLRCGMEPSECAHVRFASAAFGKASGLQKKPDDRFCVSLCAGCHRLDHDAQHNRGEREFWDTIGINPLLVAAHLYAQRGDLVAMRAVCFVAIAERRK